MAAECRSTTRPARALAARPARDELPPPRTRHPSRPSAPPACITQQTFPTRPQEHRDDLHPPQAAAVDKAQRHRTGTRAARRRRYEHAELVAHDVDTMAALLELLGPTDQAPGYAVRGQLTVRTSPWGSAQAVVIDASLLGDFATHQGACCWRSVGHALPQPARPSPVTLPPLTGSSKCARPGAASQHRDRGGRRCPHHRRWRPRRPRATPHPSRTARTRAPKDLADLQPTLPGSSEATVTEHSRYARFESARIDTDLPLPLSGSGRELPMDRARKATRSQTGRVSRCRAPRPVQARGAPAPTRRPPKTRTSRSRR
jgi:hypothetical protein